MMRFLGFAALALSLVSLVSRTPAWADDETYTIKFKQLAKGETGSYEIRDKGEDHIKVLNASGQAFINESYKYDEKLVFWERVYERPEGELPTRVLRGYGEARMKWDDESLVLPVEGKRVRIERKGDDYTYKIEGGDDAGKFKDIMAYEFEDDFTMSAFLPDKPVKLKETFRFNGKRLAKGLSKKIKDLQFDVAKTKALGRLTEVYDKDGRKFGKLVSHVEIPLLALLEDGKRLPLRKEDKMIVQVTFDLCIDGSAHVGSVRVIPYASINFKDDIEGEKVAVKVVYKAERTVTIKEIAAKK
ncbi:hypothetical protein AYO40_02675 [Planctomycetaceae bacterium SCGC AG-212-D15]|nr:hypothetical protein AYO40_02675 [Planctomycetaceae bacterium SCGC AG-212-D15]